MMRGGLGPEDEEQERCVLGWGLAGDDRFDWMPLFGRFLNFFRLLWECFRFFDGGVALIMGGCVTECDPYDSL